MERRLENFPDMVAKESKGELTVKFIGGPETFPTFESIEILRKGVIDLLNTDATFYTKALPAVFTGLISELSPEEEREIGLLRRHEQAASEDGKRRLPGEDDKFPVCLCL